MAGGVDLRPTSSLQNAEIADVLQATIPNLPWDGSFETLLEYHDYPICNQILRKDRVEMDGGTAIERGINLGEDDNAEWVLPYNVTEPNVEDKLAKLRVPWVVLQTHWSISAEEVRAQRGRAKLINLLKSRRQSAALGLAGQLEEKAWTAPQDAADKTHPEGIPSYITPITGAQVTAATHTHQGANPYYNGGVQQSDCAGIDASVATFARWRNFNTVWDNSDGSITDADIVKITRMIRRLKYTPPYIVDVSSVKGNPFRIYTDEEVFEACERRAREQNDQLGVDIAMFAGRPMINGIVINWSEQCDDDSTHPLYVINHDYHKAVVMEGAYLREVGPMNDRRQHNVWTNFLEIQLNFLCTNRQRCGGMISYVAAA